MAIPQKYDDIVIMENKRLKKNDKWYQIFLKENKS